jgi:hypothetical protein
LNEAEAHQDYYISNFIWGWRRKVTAQTLVDSGWQLLKPEIKYGAALVVGLVVASWQNDIERWLVTRPNGRKVHCISLAETERIAGLLVLAPTDVPERWIHRGLRSIIRGRFE